jgi:hypothetical protein
MPGILVSSAITAIALERGLEQARSHAEVTGRGYIVCRGVVVVGEHSARSGTRAGPRTEGQGTHGSYGECLVATLKDAQRKMVPKLVQFLAEKDGSSGRTRNCNPPVNRGNFRPTLNNSTQPSPTQH